MCGPSASTETWRTVTGSLRSIVSSPNPSTDVNYVFGVAAVGSNDVWAVGAYWNGTAYRTLTEHYSSGFGCATQTPAITSTRTPTGIATATAIVTATRTSTPVATATRTSTSVGTPPSATRTPTSTNTPVTGGTPPTNTPTSTNTPPPPPPPA